MAIREREFLRRTGMINENVYAGIQPDDGVVWRPAGDGSYQNFTLCDHTCVTEVKGKPTGGNYICEASYVFSRGSKARFAPREAIVNWTKRVAEAHEVARDIFIHRHFDDYCWEFEIQPTWADAIQYELTDPMKKIEVNRFGGSPEMLPECAGIIADCKAAGLVVNLTTPGRRFMTNKKFVADIAANPPQILAMSFDDLNPDDIARLSKMDLEGIRAEWRKIDPHHGQKQKAFEALYAAKLLREMGIPIKILFNVVIHPGNIGHLDSVMNTLTESVPGSFANPYPAQSFGGEGPCWTEESLPALRAHILQFIVGTLVGTPGVTHRLSYYMMLEAAFRKWNNKKDLYRLACFMSGIDAWDFTLRPGAYRYVQIGKSMEVVPGSLDTLPYPGGHISCFWNPHLGFPEQIGGNVEELAETITTGMVRRGLDLRKKAGLMYVQTSNIMPRLAFDMVSTELGIPRDLVPEYLGVRHEHCGF